MAPFKKEIPCQPSCKDRSATCHAKCEKYMAYRKKLDEYNNNHIKESNLKSDFLSFKFEAIERVVKGNVRVQKSK